MKIDAMTMCASAFAAAGLASTAAAGQDAATLGAGITGNPRVGVVLQLPPKTKLRSLRPLTRQVEEIFRTARLTLEWELLGGMDRPGLHDQVVVVELRGICSPFRIDAVQGQAEGARLGWTLIQNGEVTPYSVVDCDQIARTLRYSPGSAARQPSRYHEFWALAARVLAHEMLHSLLRTTRHEGTDCLRSPLRQQDLRQPARLQPVEVRALARLAQGAPPTVAKGATRPGEDKQIPAAR